jgi:hypothetical protein
MAVPGDPGRAGAINRQVIRTIVYMLDITAAFSLKLWTEAVGSVRLLLSEMNTFSSQIEPAPNYFFWTGIQKRPELRIELNNLHNFTTNQTLSETN